MFCSDIPQPLFFIFSSFTPQLLYFSHLPVAIIGLILGIFVYLKNKENDRLVSRLLLFISVIFFLWSFLDLIIWTNIDSGTVVFTWSIINLVEMLATSGTLYFAYVFLEKKDVALKFKMIIGFLLSVFVVLIPTRLNIPGFDIINCEAEQGQLIYYFYFLEILFFTTLAIYLIKKIIQAKKEERGMVIYFAVGALCFLASFSGANIIGSLTERWEILQYGLFGMPVFMALLVYLIVHYKAFNIKLLTAQALVFSIGILIFSEFFFIRTTINRIITSIILALVLGFGWWLVRSVKSEVLTREALAVSNSSLQLANERLKKLDESKSEFLSIASHQLRTPLTGIKGYLSMILEGDYGAVTPKVKPVIENVFQESDRMTRLVNIFLNVSRIESGKFIITRKDTNFVELVKEVLKTLKLGIEQKKLELVFNEPKQLLPLLKIDGDKIKDVMSNLIDNAIKYTPKGKIEIFIEQIGQAIKVMVKDTGIGIPKGEDKELFKKFVRGEGVAQINTGGSGLGLFIVKKIVEAHGGKVWVESAGKGLGSSFIFSLPMA
ncbi:MAG: HAMP domain-containing sensor histidine kinase [Patescibacteria group bacterium]|jgi:signal transduction histidine kinase